MESDKQQCDSSTLFCALLHQQVVALRSGEGLMSQNPSEVGETTSSRESVKIGCVFLGPLEGWRHLLSACKKDALLLGLCLP